MYCFDVEVVEVIIKTGKANYDMQNHSGKTAVWFAAMMGHTRIFDMLVKAGADKSIPENHGKTPLMLAVERGHKMFIGEHF
jgi:ankyrin repeat protein